MTIDKCCIPKSKFISCDANKVFHFEQFVGWLHFLVTTLKLFNYIFDKVQVGKI